MASGSEPTEQGSVSQTVAPEMPAMPALAERERLRAGEAAQGRAGAKAAICVFVRSRTDGSPDRRAEPANAKRSTPTECRARGRGRRARRGRSRQGGRRRPERQATSKNDKKKKPYDYNADTASKLYTDPADVCVYFHTYLRCCILLITSPFRCCESLFIVEIYAFN